MFVVLIILPLILILREMGHLRCFWGGRGLLGFWNGATEIYGWRHYSGSDISMFPKTSCYNNIHLPTNQDRADKAELICTNLLLNKAVLIIGLFHDKNHILTVTEHI